MGTQVRGKVNAEASGAAGLRMRVENLIEKRRLRDAFKEAKVGFKQDGSPENRRLLERTYLLRIQELQRQGMPVAAAEVAQHLLDFGISDPAITEQLIPVLPTIGLAQKAVALSASVGGSEA